MWCKKIVNLAKNSVLYPAESTWWFLNDSWIFETGLYSIFGIVLIWYITFLLPFFACYIFIVISSDNLFTKYHFNATFKKCVYFGLFFLFKSKSNIIWDFFYKKWVSIHIPYIRNGHMCLNMQMIEKQYRHVQVQGESHKFSLCVYV